MPKPTDEQLHEFLSRGVSEVIELEMLKKQLQSDKPITVYFGIDPTGYDIHLGHAIPLRKLAKLQEWGHKVILLIGDFTARIGDPTGRDQSRVPLTREQVLANAKNYQAQASKILDFAGKNPVELRHNHDWLSKLTFEYVIGLAGQFTVQQMLERDMFQKRMKEGLPISLHEFLYPLMQGYDSVVMDVDLELGGSDQLFNMLAGRHLMKRLKNKDKSVMTFQLIEGSDGRKMSKSFNNHIPITAEPNDMFGKAMSIKDDLIIKWFWLATSLSSAEIDEMDKGMREQGMNPRDAKVRLAKEIVTMYHSAAAADEAEQAFINQFQKGELPTDIEVVKIDAGSQSLVELLVKLKLCTSKADARRQIEQGAVKINSSVERNVDSMIHPKDGDIIQKGKRGFKKIKLT